MKRFFRLVGFVPLVTACILAVDPDRTPSIDTGDTDTDADTDTALLCDGWFDAASALCWETSYNTARMNFEIAAAHCAAQGEGWHLPSISN